MGRDTDEIKTVKGIREWNLGMVSGTLLKDLATTYPDIHRKWKVSQTVLIG